MTRGSRCALPLLAALCLVLSFSSAAPAQGISGGEFDRAMRREGPYIPYDGAPFSHRYGFEAGPAFYFNQNPHCLFYLEYLDRLDRAERFGYRCPAPPATFSPCKPFRLIRQ